MEEQKTALTHDEALELLAYLVSSAECRLREPPEYGEFRLINAALRLAQAWRPRCPIEMCDFLDELIESIPEGAVKRDADRQGFMVFLDECSKLVAREILRRSREELVEDGS